MTGVHIVTGVHNNGDGGSGDRPVIDGVVVPRNSGRGNDPIDLSLFLCSGENRSGLFSGTDVALSSRVVAMIDRES